MEADYPPRKADMRPARISIRNCRCSALRAFCGALMLWLTGCVAVPEEPAHEPLVHITAPAHERLEFPAPEPEPALPQAPVAIVVSGDLPAYTDVADRLVSLLGHEASVVHVLGADGQTDAASIPAGAPTPRAVVAIGLEAALYSRTNIDAPLIFCQVLNYADHPELTQATAAVSMLAAFDQQLEFWKAIDDSLEVVGTIVGPGHDTLIADAQAAAGSRGMTLAARFSDSDRETVWQFKRLSSQIDGFWLIPDNRVLSISAIEELMAYAAARRLPVMVSSPDLLRFGALMSLAPTPAQVADSVFSVLDRLPTYQSGVLELVSPDAFQVDVNRAVATRLGLRID